MLQGLVISAGGDEAVEIDVTFLAAGGFEDVDRRVDHRRGPAQIGLHPPGRRKAPRQYLGDQPGVSIPVAVGRMGFAQRGDEREPIVQAGEARQLADEEEIATASGTVEELSLIHI